jgi:hypothetical protein
MKITMTEKRFNEIYEEAHKRMFLWLKNESFDRMTCHGSYILFQLSLGLMGYPFELRHWMKKEDFNCFITEEEYNSEQMDYIATILFELGQEINCIKSL